MPLPSACTCGRACTIALPHLLPPCSRAHTAGVLPPCFAALASPSFFSLPPFPCLPVSHADVQITPPRENPPGNPPKHTNKPRTRRRTKRSRRKKTESSTIEVAKMRSTKRGKVEETLFRRCLAACSDEETKSRKSRRAQTS